ncbi:hypothetical protein AUM47_17230 [Cronobacter malonaticus]|uniref:hypothetical protein n=1 Tax=Cronobacter malonaticus TaxID=413503 RepID=UPI000517C45B|nr:hypothetical protein [Cronobacter malonaticus]EGT4373210.1 hypothetical protein [Cronobacter malonaticus]MDI6469466.1 hypothetical protein [Cronobacter malonaticus]HAU5445714.1 hypothetical protein [Cronobacter malonaticus]
MSTISNERLEKMAAGGGFNFNEVEAISSELLALRKDRERVVPAAWAHRLVNKHSGVIHPWVYGSAEKSPSEGDVFRIEVMPLYAAPQPVAVPDAATAIRACLEEFPESVHDIVEECADIAENASRAAMIKSAMQRCDKCGLTGIHACMGGMETDTTSQKFESLAGKVVGGSEDFECTPVADLYELLTKCGECYDYTTSARVASDWIKEGYSAREYVKLDRLQEALLFAAPEPCK